MTFLYEFKICIEIEQNSKEEQDRIQDDIQDDDMWHTDGVWCMDVVFKGESSS